MNSRNTFPCCRTVLTEFEIHLTRPPFSHRRDWVLKIQRNWLKSPVITNWNWYSKVCHWSTFGWKWDKSTLCWQERPLQFSTIYLCEKAFFPHRNLKTKQRNRLSAEPDLRLFRFSVVPDYQALCRSKQAHPSHWNLRSRLLQATTDFIVVCNWSYKLMHEKNVKS
jgi:hypothetical protein